MPAVSRSPLPCFARRSCFLQTTLRKAVNNNNYCKIKLVHTFSVQILDQIRLGIVSQRLLKVGIVTTYLSQQKQLTNIARIAKAAAHMGPGRLIINAAPRA